MFFLNDVPFTFDDLPEGYMYDHNIVEEFKLPYIRKLSSLFLCDRTSESREFTRRYTGIL
jgi:hypothetical protein